VGSWWKIVLDDEVYDSKQNFYVIR
jgi:hypothetical protein